MYLLSSTTYHGLTFCKIPVDGLERGLLKRVTDKVVLELSEWVTRGEYAYGIQGRHRGQGDAVVATGSSKHE